MENNRTKTQTIKAVALLSGGLDSMLAAHMVQQQGVEVQGVHFSTGFCTIQRRRRIALPEEIGSRRLRNEALQTAAQIEIPIEIIDVSTDYIPVILKPRHGYGAHMNPCQDCRAFMLRQAGEFMRQIGASFIVTGEVVGQRPNSQKRHLLRQTARESGLDGLILRPLSAKLLDPSIPETKGWVDREALYDISGRGRRQQIQLAEQFGITEYSQPSGGCCMLVEEAFSRRLKDFLAHSPSETLTQYQVALLSTGRHLRLPDGTKVIVGRHEGENNFLDRSRRPYHWRFEATGGSSPVALVKGPLDDNQVQLVAAIVASYSKGHDCATVTVLVDTSDNVIETSVIPLDRSEILAMNVNRPKAKRNRPQP